MKYLFYNHIENQDLKHKCHGFTLLELLLVCALAALFSAMMAPRLSRMIRTMEMRGAIREVVSSLDLAAQFAIRYRTETRFVVESGKNAFGLEKNQSSNHPQIEKTFPVRALSEKHTLPDRITITLESNEPLPGTDPSTHHALIFFPDGSRTPGMIQLTDSRGKSQWIRLGPSLGITELFQQKPNETKKD